MWFVLSVKGLHKIRNMRPHRHSGGDNGKINLKIRGHGFSVAEWGERRGSNPRAACRALLKNAGSLHRTGCILWIDKQPVENGANDGARTRDNLDHNQGLYQLSYVRHKTPLYSRKAGRVKAFPSKIIRAKTQNRPRLFAPRHATSHAVYECPAFIFRITLSSGDM
jgi:hypothetical protein